MKTTYPSKLFTRILAIVLTSIASASLAFQPIISDEFVLTYDTASSPNSTQIFLRADGYPTPASYKWTKDNRPLIKGDQDTYSTTQVTLASAGLYRLTVEAEKIRATSKPVPVGVVRTGETKLSPFPEGRTLLLKQIARGPGITYQWFKDGQPLSNLPGKRSGSTTATLRLLNLDSADEGDYHCVVSLGTLSLLGQSFTIAVALKPAVTGFSGIDNWAVGRPVTATIEAVNNPTRYEIKGLPSGLTLNSKTGALAGRPLTAGNFHLKARASNAAGASHWVKVTVNVTPFPKGATGNFIGLVGRTGSHDPGYGGLWKFTVSGSGAFTGIVDIGTTRYPFSGRLQNPSSGSPEVWIQLASGWLVMNIKIDIAQQRADGLVALNNFSFSLPLEAKKVLPVKPSVAPANWLGLHYVKLSPDAAVLGNAAYPQEEAIGQITVRHNGSYTWTGRLSDGAAYTMAGQITPQGAFTARTLLYGKRGSIQGWQELLEPEGRVSGFLEWIKYRRPGDASFPNGFPLHSLDVREPGV